MNIFVASIMILVMLALVFFFVLTVTEVSRTLRQRHGKPLPEAPRRPASPELDAAAQELRMRYARGEISREEYLQRKIDLEEY